MSAAFMAMTPEELEATVKRAVEPLRFEVERLRSGHSRDPIPIPEAARRLGVTTRTIQRWLKSGALKAVQLGGLRFVLLSDLSEQ